MTKAAMKRMHCIQTAGLFAVIICMLTLNIHAGKAVLNVTPAGELAHLGVEYWINGQWQSFGVGNTDSDNWKSYYETLRDCGIEVAMVDLTNLHHREGPRWRWEWIDQIVSTRDHLVANGHVTYMAFIAIYPQDAEATGMTQIEMGNFQLPPPISPLPGPTQWLFQGPPAESKVLAVDILSPEGQES